MKRLHILALAIWLSGCAQNTVQPLLPDVAVAPVYKETGALTGHGAAINADDWWQRFQDPDMDRLQRQLLADSADLSSALARYQQAQAATDSLRSAQFLRANAQFGAQRNRQSAERPLRGSDSPDYYNSGTLGLNLEYDLDLWGRIRQQVAAGVASEQAAQADLAAAQLALQARLAENLLALRGTDQELDLLRDTEAAYERAQALIERRHEGGLSSGLDLSRAQSQLATTRTLIPQVVAQRALYEHSIAALVGVSATSFSLAPKLLPETIPQVPLTLPSELLKRRPDIAAAQQRVTAANASVGVAQTAYYPSVTLSAVAGVQSSDLDHLVNAPNLFWSLGPGLLMNVLDGGRRNAEVARAQARLVESSADYRGVVLTAFQEVEDQLALLNHYAEAAAADRLAVDASQRTLDLASSRYRDGAVSYLDVVTAQTDALQAQRTAVDLATRQRRATVQLVRALGGGWSAEQGSSVAQSR